MYVYHTPIVWGVSVPIYKQIRAIVLDILATIKCMTHLSITLFMSVHHIPIVWGVSVPIYKQIRAIVLDILVIIKCMTHLSFVLIINEKCVNF